MLQFVTMNWPKISFVTVCKNGEHYLEEHIQNVLMQNYPNLEFIIVDGGSTDRTVEIIKKYEKHIHWWASEKDESMYHAINKGFAHSSGDVMFAISHTDLLHVGALITVGRVFMDLPEVEWITGIPTGFSEDSMSVGIGNIPHWSRYRFFMGANRYIQAESTFWKRSLWDKAGGKYCTDYKWVMDFELWARFFRHARLYPVNAILGGYREHFDSSSVNMFDQLEATKKEIIARELKEMKYGWLVHWYRAFDKAIQVIPKVRGLWNRMMKKVLYRMPLGDFAPVIRYHSESRKFYTKLPK